MVYDWQENKCAQHALAPDAAPLRFAARLKRVPLGGALTRLIA